MLLNVFNWISLFRKIPHSFLRPFFLLFYAFYVVFTGKNRSMATLFYLSIFFLLCRSHISFGNILGIKNHISSSFLLLLFFFLLEPADSRCSPGSYRQTRPINWHVVNPFRFTVDFLFFSSAATLGARRSSLIFFFSLFLLFFSYSWGWQPRSVQRRRSIRFIFFLFFLFLSHRLRPSCDRGNRLWLPWRRPTRSPAGAGQRPPVAMATECRCHGDPPTPALSFLTAEIFIRF